MAIIYVGPTAAGLADGTSWANRYGSLNAAEDRPIQAGDTVYVGPGVYREQLTVDVSGGAGNVITYIGDYTGANTDGVGGVVRITGSDNDQTATRASAIIAAAQRDYRTFRGFRLDTTTGITVHFQSAGISDVIEQCYIENYANTDLIRFIGAAQSGCVVRNCFIDAGQNSSAYAVDFVHGATVDNTSNYVENCIFYGGYAGVNTTRVGNITVRNCYFSRQFISTFISAAMTAGQTFTVNNCIVTHSNQAFRDSSASGAFVEDYNTVYDVTTPRVNVAIGANSVTYPPLFDARWFFEMVNGGRLISPFDLGKWSQLINIPGTNPTTTDMRGTGAIGGVREWGPLEYDTTLEIEGGGGAVSISPYRGNIG